MKRKKINYQLLLRRVCLIVLDIVLIIISSLMALLTRFEFDIEQIPEEFLDVLVSYGILMIFVTLSVFAVFRIYSSLWEYAGLEETFKIIGAVVVSSLCDMAIVVGFGKHLPRSYYVIRTFYLIALVGGSRFFYRLLRLRYRKRQHYSIKKKKKIMLIGAGEAGRTLIQEIQNSRYLDQKICCVIDDNRRKIGRYILGIRVVGDRNAIKRSVEHYGIEQIIIAIPSAGSRKIRPILEICKDTGCELKILPGVYQLVNGEVNVSKLRPVNIEDLLGREEINVNIDEIMDYVCSKTILVTGGGGSIGSELCRQIAAHKPERLIIFDIYENNAYDIQQELKMKYPTIRSVLKSEGVVEGGTGARHMQNCNKKKLLIVTNHSYMLYRFRKELIQRLMEDYEVVISTPFVGHEEDLQELGAHCIETEVDRRSVNPVTDLKLLRTYKKILKRENPDLVITYSIKPNIYAGYLCGKMKIPFLANVQGLGTAFQKPVLSDMVTVMYRTALRKVEKVIFENQANAQEFKKRRILSEEKEVVLHGAGINLKEYRYRFYPNNEKIHFLYLGRIMKEKGMDELFGAIERLRKDGCEFVLDLVGFFEEEYRKKVEHLQKEGIKSRRLCNDVPVCVC